MIRILDKNGKEVPSGAIVSDREGNQAVLLAAIQLNQPGKDGKVLVRWVDGDFQHTYYARIFGLTVEES